MSLYDIERSCKFKNVPLFSKFSCFIIEIWHGKQVEAFRIMLYIGSSENVKLYKNIPSCGPGTKRKNIVNAC